MTSVNTDNGNFDDINNKKNSSEDIKNLTSDNKATTIAAVEKESTETVNGSKHKSGEIGNGRFSNTEDKNTDKKELGEKFFSFTFYKVDPKWRWLNEIGKEEASREFLELLNIANTKMRIRTYSTIGLRHESEFMIWTVSSSLENIQVLASKIYTTIIGKYIEPVSTYLSLTRKSIYSNQTRPGFETEDEPMPYVVVYPFIKSREWYLLSFEKRRQMMEEHIKVGRKYPEIRLNTTYSFGIDDQDFMLAFETPDLSRFQSLIMELRETKVSKYIIKDTPMIPCVLKNMGDIIKNIG
jgi:chlorite dismutase